MSAPRTTGGLAVSAFSSVRSPWASAGWAARSQRRAGNERAVVTFEGDAHAFGASGYAAAAGLALFTQGVAVPRFLWTADGRVGARGRVRYVSKPRSAAHRSDSGTSGRLLGGPDPPVGEAALATPLRRLTAAAAVTQSTSAGCDLGSTPTSAGCSERELNEGASARGSGGLLRGHADQLRTRCHAARHGFAFTQQHARQAPSVDAARVDTRGPGMKLRLVTRVVTEDHVGRAGVERTPEGAPVAVVAPPAVAVDRAHAEQRFERRARHLEARDDAGVDDLLPRARGDRARAASPRASASPPPRGDRPRAGDRGRGASCRPSRRGASARGSRGRSSPRAAGRAPACRGGSGSRTTRVSHEDEPIGLRHEPDGVEERLDFATATVHVADDQRAGLRLAIRGGSSPIEWLQCENVEESPRNEAKRGSLG